MVTNDGAAALPWSPDQDLRRLIELRLAELREAFQQQFQADREQSERSGAARGVLLSGGRLQALAKSAAKGLRQFGVGAADAIVDAVLLDNGGVLPARSEGWISQYFEAVFAERPASLARAIAEGRTAPSGNRDAIRQALLGILAPSIDPGRRRLESRILEAGVRQRVRDTAPAGVIRLHATGAASTKAYEYDFMISHAGEDTDSAAIPLAEALKALGYKVWLDRYEITVGDIVLRKIDKGLARSRFGIVIVSHRYFDKPWAVAELAALFARQEGEGRKVILPVWHEITDQDVRRVSPMMAGLYGLKTADGIEHVANEIVRAFMGSEATAAETIAEFGGGS